MEKCEGVVENECATHDLKGNLVDQKGSSSVSNNDKAKGLDTALEDNNCNLTGYGGKLNAENQDTQSDGKKISATHGGPINELINGLINGLEIISGEKMNHILQHIPNSNISDCSSSHQNSKLKSNSCVVESSRSTEHCSKVTEECNHKIVDSLSTTTSSEPSTDKGLNAMESTDGSETVLPPIEYVSYESELQMPDIMRLIQKDLSEPYSIYTYRYFIHNWPKLCFLAMDGNKCVGAIVCKLDIHRKVVKRGYIAMLAVDEKYRKRKIGSNLVLKAIRAMVADDADEVVLETEITNQPALRLYENLGFVRDKRLFRYYLNGVDALRLKLWLR